MNLVEGYLGDVICYESVEGVFEWLDGAGVVVSRAVCFGRFVWA